MATKLFYKIIADVKDGYNTKRLDIPEVNHNIDDSFIVNVSDLHYKIYTTDGYVKHRFACITQEVFDNIISDKLIYPSVSISKYGECYIGAIIVRCNKGDILTYITRNTKNIIYLRPLVSFEVDNHYTRYTTDNVFPKRNVKIFLTKEEYENDKNKKNKKSEDNRKIELENYEKVEKVAPVFSFKTPKFKIIEIVKSTAYLPNIKVGDIIYGELPIIKETDNRKFGALHGIGTMTNWIILYVNDVKVNTISPKTFPMLFFNNIIVEEMNN